VSEELLERCRDAVRRASTRGAEQAEAFATSVRESKVSVEQDDIGTAFAHDETRFGLRVRSGGATGFAATNDGSPAALDEAVESALALARVSPPDANDDLAEPRAVTPVAGLCDPRLEGLDVEAVGKLVGELAARTRDLDGRVRIDNGWVSASATDCAVASSTGIEVFERTTGADAMLFGMAVDGSRVGSFDVEQADVCSLEELSGELERLPRRFVQKVVTALDAGDGESFVGPLVLSREAVAEFLLPALSSVLSARAVRLGRSRWAGKLGERVCSEAFGLRDDGTLPGRPGSSAFDREGLPHRPLPLVEGGVLRSFLFNTREARLAGRKEGSTGHAAGGAGGPPALGPTNLEVAAGDAADDAIVQGVERGILLSRFSGNTDPVSGDFSGVAKGSFLLRAGRPPRPIQETLISGNLFELLGRIEAVGRERRWIDGTVFTPMLRLGGVSVTAG
jgi:PmbA protein